MSGKFYFDEDNIARVVDHSNIKITGGLSGFTLTTAEGIVYTFGGGTPWIEKTTQVKTNGTDRIRGSNTTTWFLKKITSPEGAEITFHYNAIHTKAQLGPSQSVILKPNISTYPGGDPTCHHFCGGQFSGVKHNRVDYNTQLLTAITTNNGQRIDFSYLGRSEHDVSGDVRLAYIDIFKQTTMEESPILIKTYSFEYDDYTVTDDINQRFYLKKIEQLASFASPSVPAEKLTHEFVYNTPELLPSQQSTMQDYYGYARGSGIGPDNFFPRPVDYNDYEFGYLGIDRSPNFEYTKAGTLQKVIFPTGGYQEYTYEPHAVGVVEPRPSSESDTTWTSKNLSLAGIDDPDGQTYTTNLTVSSERVRIEYRTEWNPASGTPPGSTYYDTPDDIHFISYLEIWKVSDNTREFEARHKLYRTDFFHIELEPGVQYEIRLKVRYDSHKSFVYIKYNPVVPTNLPTTITVNKPACGIRVKSIKSYDPLTNTSTYKYYRYGQFGNLGISSGVGVPVPSFGTPYKGEGICHGGPGWSGVLFECTGGGPGLRQISSSTVSGSFTFSGSPVAYRYVVESDHPDFVNGATEHQFYTYYEPLQPAGIIGDVFALSPSGALPSMNGLEEKTTIYRKNGNSFYKVKMIENNYGSNHQNLGNAYHHNYIIRKRYEPDLSSSNPLANKVKAFDVNMYSYIRGWHPLNSTVTTEYDENGQNPVINTVSYSYTNTDHLQPTSIITENSKGQTILQEMKYPVDFTTGVYPAMVNKHIISPVIETTTQNNGTVMDVLQTEYGAWPTDESGQFFYKPQLIKTKRGTTAMENRVNYHNYDTWGNPLELSKEHDMRISYLWNHDKTFVVAEVKNAARGDIAYTGFEGEDYGRWQLTGGTITSTAAFTGGFSFNGIMECTVAGNKNYIVTLWKHGEGTTVVNSQPGEVLYTADGWSLLRWEINNATVIEVSGLEIDEVRVHPADALMTTYTYKPFIGVTASCDVNNKPTWYFYDGFNRLELIKDIDKNIVKKFEYKFRQSFTPCATTTPQWEPTGVTWCVIGPNPNANFTGVQKMQYKDMNTCSPTYLDEKWEDSEPPVPTGACEPVPNCDTPDKRVVNGVCITGRKVLISSSGSGTTWTCMFRYVWDTPGGDGFEGHPFIENHTSQCFPEAD